MIDAVMDDYPVLSCHIIVPFVCAQMERTECPQTRTSWFTRYMIPRKGQRILAITLQLPCNLLAKIFEVCQQFSGDSPRNMAKNEANQAKTRTSLGTVPLELGTVSFLSPFCRPSFIHNCPYDGLKFNGWLMPSYRIMAFQL